MPPDAIFNAPPEPSPMTNAVPLPTVRLPWPVFVAPPVLVIPENGTALADNPVRPLPSPMNPGVAVEVNEVPLTTPEPFTVNVAELAALFSTSRATFALPDWLKNSPPTEPAVVPCPCTPVENAPEPLDMPHSAMPAPVVALTVLLTPTLFP